MQYLQLKPPQINIDNVLLRGETIVIIIFKALLKSLDFSPHQKFMTCYFFSYAKLLSSALPTVTTFLPEYIVQNS